jgi:hypothetical protein
LNEVQRMKDLSYAAISKNFGYRNSKVSTGEIVLWAAVAVLSTLATMTAAMHMRGEQQWHRGCVHRCGQHIKQHDRHGMCRGAISGADDMVSATARA